MTAHDEVLVQLAERSRLIGADPALVLYGGGNTSAKGEITDHLGRVQRVMWVKGSGADMRDSREADYPGLRLDELVPLRDLEALTDEEMTDLVTRALLDPGSRRPSIETLLHAFLPHRHIDHVHADAICALTNHAEGPRVTREALGDGFAYVDWLRPGFALSKLVGELGDYEGVVLAHHGLVTWADDSDACLQRTRAVVDRAQAFVAEHRIAAGQPPRHEDMPDDELRTLLLRLRGAMSATGRRVLRVDDRLRHIADRPDLDAVVGGGVATADHMMRVKPRSASVRDADEAAARIDDYAGSYLEFVERNRALLPPGYGPHDPMPRVVLVPGVGAITTGGDRKEAKVIADVALHTHQVASDVADAFGVPESLPEAEEFGIDYWPMELYKLSLKPAPARFAGHVVIVTGAGSGIGRRIALTLAAAGASVVVADLDGPGAEQTVQRIAEARGPEPALVVGDQSDAAVVGRTVDAAIDAFGGIDGVVLNAGIGVPGRLVDLEPAAWDAGLRINLTSAFLLTQAAMRVMVEQGSGGSLVYVATKNALGPGAGFGGYSVSKAGMLQLMRIAALEGGEHAIRANAVNPDAVFDDSKLWEDGVREQRAAAHGIRPEELEDFYAARNLLNRRVTTSDVASAVAFLLSEESSRTTGAVIPVDGGVPGAFPR